MTRRIIVPMLLAAALAPAGVSSAAAPARGKLLFLRCASCHDISSSPSPKIGPNLKGVFGRKVASLKGYAYSPALKAQSFIWNEQMLDRWLEKPSDVAPGTAMAFAGLPEKADRDAIIDFLRDAAQ